MLHPVLFCSETAIKLLAGKLLPFLHPFVSPGNDLRFTTALDFCSVPTGNEIFYRPVCSRGSQKIPAMQCPQVVLLLACT
ncbi:hypothetical protein RRG08_056376 [Elysia crispata]|uniref:Uncharacterized protein n=1 Tax=Elysia crispata TaxID=231223 RepID=A0AAE1DKQ6_9GAST|nr:hypothetical protein RRG08_056376 [Elysia crispata]